MTVTIPWAYIEVGIGLAAFVAVGAVIGVVVTYVRIVEEGRRGY